ncbi:MAG TPA: hypothetical protein VI796_03530 [Candidatus Thermoplasmatota archaeon]|nr:hypothetical protein [Candidatus Thermoplasmatota archaeon]
MPSAASQQEALYAFQMNIPSGQVQVRVGETVEIPLEVLDLSKDSTGALAGTATANQGIQHRISFRREYVSDQTTGWSVQAPSPLTTRGGDVVDTAIRVGLTQFVKELRLDFRIIATMDTSAGRIVETLNITVYTFGVESFTLVGARPAELGPDDVGTLAVRVRNNALLPRAFDLAITSNPCGFDIAKSNNNLVAPLTVEEITLSVLAPSKKLWYNSDNCEVRVQVSPSDNPSHLQSTTIFVTVNGFYVNPVWLFWALAMVAALVLLYFIIARRKARIEEELLGKPQRPWTIPVERVYLEKLKGKDARAWYVVRHYLMEDEYRSALLWYKDYRRATKGKRTKERTVLRQEKAYEEWKAAWERRIAKPLAQADRFEARLGRKLEHKAARRHRKLLRKHKVLLAKMEKAHEAQSAQAKARWEKETRRAERKGLPAPTAPHLEEPDYPTEPKAARLTLKDHRYGRKAARFRRRSVRRQGNLEVRFEKADARRLRRLRLKVQRVARRLEDPEFVAEHPLLQDA